MDSIFDKILYSNQTSSEKNVYLSNILMNIQSNCQKIDFLKQLIEKIITFQEIDFDFYVILIQNLSLIEILTYDYFFFIVNTTNKIELWIVYLSILLKNNDVRVNSQIKGLLAKKLNKDPELWNYKILNDFYEYKQKKNWFSNQKVEYPIILKNFNYLNNVKKIDLISEFFCQNEGLFPISLDFKEIAINWILLLDKKEKILIEKLINNLLFYCRIARNSLQSCFKRGFSFLQFNYDESDIFKPIYSFFNFIEKLDNNEIINFTNFSLIGSFWTTENWISCFKNLVKLGLTNNITIIFVTLTKYLISQRSFEILNKILDIIIPSIFIYISFEKLRENVLQILELYLFGSILTDELLEKFIVKIEKAVDSLKNEQTIIAYRFFFMCSLIIKKYENILQIKKFELINQKIIQKFNFQINPEEIQRIINQNDWVSKFKEDMTSYKGLINLGNTCYMNSVLQALYMTKQFRKRILKLKFSIKTNEQNNTLLNNFKKISSAYQLQRLFALLFQSKRTEINPTFFRNVLPDFFKGSYIQQDASEFCKIYLDSFEKALKESSDENLLNDIFGGQLKNTVICKNCNSEFEKIETFIDLHINFENGIEDYNLDNMIKNTFSNEELKEKNKYFCSKCNDYNDANKNMTIKKLPNHLMIILNRFWFDFQLQKRNKINKEVEIPLQIDMSPFSLDKEKNSLYELYGVIIHRGNNAEFGHYYTFAKENIENSEGWMIFNDSKVNKMNGQKEIIDYLKGSKDDTPYILFYENIEIIEMEKNCKDVILLDNLLKKLIEQDNALYLKEEQVNCMKINTAAKQININNNFNYNSLNYFKNNDDDSDDDNDQYKGIQSGGNQYIF